MTLFQTSSLPASPHKRWTILAVLYLASFMNLVDISIVNVALPSIQADMGATPTQLKWVAETYVLALAVGLLPCGRFGDVWGRTRMFIWGLIGFTVASLICGIAPDIQSLIAARTAQGIGAAMMVPQVLALVHVTFPPEEKAKAFGLFGTISSLGLVAGPIIGGALISMDIADLGWRPAFLINLPLGIVALIGALVYLPRFEQDARTRPDWIGTLLFALATLLLILPLIEGRALGWPWLTIASMLAVLPTISLFAFYEHRRSAGGHAALIPPGLLSNTPYLGRLALITLFFSGIPGLFLVLAIFLQSGFGLTPLQSGLVTTPFPMGVILATMTTQRFADRFLFIRIAGGAAFLTVGMVWLYFVLGATGVVLNPYDFAAPLLICGIGMGSAVMSLFQITMASVSAQDAGAGSGAMQTFQQIGAALGIAIAGQLFFSALGEGGMAQGSSSAPQFVKAAVRATTYSILIFACLTLIVDWQALRETKA